jgi:hypothetical protein
LQLARSGGDGVPVAAWIQCDSSGTNVWVSRRESGEWTPARPVGTATDDRYPAVASSASGQAVVLWVSRGAMWEARFSPQSGWSAAQLDAGSSTSARYPRVFMRADGGAVAAWSERADPRSLLRARRREDGRWDEPEALLVDVAAGALDPVFDADAAGNVRAAWSDRTGSWTARYRFDGGWEGPELIEPRGGADALAVEADGAALLAWRRVAGVLVQRFDRVTGWQTPEAFDVGAVGVDTVSVDHGRLGGLVAWSGATMGGSTVWASRRVAGGSWETARVLGRGYYPAAAIDDAGKGVVAWLDAVGEIDSGRLLATTFSSAGWGAAETIGSVPARYIDRAVTIDQDGTALVLFADHPWPVASPDTVTLWGAQERR